ncbi:6994_t:CDS:2, partial [Dentiscutata erythropus]
MPNAKRKFELKTSKGAASKKKPDNQRPATNKTQRSNKRQKNNIANPIMLSNESSLQPSQTNQSDKEQ